MAQTRERKARFKIISVELPIEFYKEFERVAKEANITKSEIIRAALRNHLKR